MICRDLLFPGRSEPAPPPLGSFPQFGLDLIKSGAEQQVWAIRQVIREIPGPPLPQTSHQTGSQHGSHNSSRELQRSTHPELFPWEVFPRRAIPSQIYPIIPQVLLSCPLGWVLRCVLPSKPHSSNSSLGSTGINWCRFPVAEKVKLSPAVELPGPAAP